MSKVYKIKQGDTLTKIAKENNTTVSAIQLANSTLIKDVNKIQVGWVITIPDSYITDTKIKNALTKCLDAIERLPEFQNLLKLM